MGNSGFSLITSPKRVKIEFFHLLRAPRCRESEIALSLLDRVTFQDVGQGWGPKFAPFLSQLYAMTFFDFCHAVAWTGFYNGEFIVSRRRLAAQPLRMWTFLRDLAAQPDPGWMHQALSSTARNSTAANAAFAHLERALLPGGRGMLAGCVPVPGRGRSGRCCSVVISFRCVALISSISFDSQAAWCRARTSFFLARVSSEGSASALCARPKRTAVALAATRFRWANGRFPGYRLLTYLIFQYLSSSHGSRIRLSVQHNRK